MAASVVVSRSIAAAMISVLVPAPASTTTPVLVNAAVATVSLPAPPMKDLSPVLRATVTPPAVNPDALIVSRFAATIAVVPAVPEPNPTDVAVPDTVMSFTLVVKLVVVPRFELA